MVRKVALNAAVSASASPRSRASTNVRRPFAYWINRSFRWWSFLPAAILMAVLTLYPIMNLIWMSVSTIEFAQGRDIWTFTPARNFDLLVSDRVLRHAFFNTLMFVVFSVAAEMVLGLGLALLVGRL